MVEAFAIVRMRSVTIAELFVQLRGGEMRLIGGLNRNAGIEIIARLAPQFFLRAQAAERQQQQGVVGMRREPALGAVYLPHGRCIVAGAVGIARSQFAVPVLIETALNDAGGTLRALQRDVAFGCGTRHTRVTPQRVGDFVPGIIQRGDICGMPLEVLGLCAAAQFARLRDIVDFALFELIDHRQRFFPIFGLLQRLQFQPQSRRVLLRQGSQYAEGIRRTAIF